MIRLSQDRTKTLLAIHGWSAVFLGLVLYVIILTGVASVFSKELGDWSSPLTGATPLEFPAGTDASLRRAAATIDPQFHEDMFALPRAGDRLWAFFHKHDVDEDGKPIDRGVQVDIDPRNGEVIARREGTGDEIGHADAPSALANFFIELHVRLHIPNPWGLLVTGVLGLAMLVAAVTGFVMHRHLFRELFTLRRRGDRLLTARDAHVIAGTWNLPFAFILAFTGSFFSFAGAFGIPAMAMVAFGGDQEKMIETVIGVPPAVNPAPAVIGNLDLMLDDARRRAGSEPGFISIQHWGRADAVATVSMMPREGALTGATYLYDGPSAAFRLEKPSLGLVPSAGGALFTLMAPLHFGNFAGVFSKAVWFALGFAGAYVTLTGLMLWTTRRADQPGWIWLARATVWVGYGLPLALLLAACAYFPARAADAVASDVMMRSFLAACAALALFVFPARDLALRRHLLLAATGLAMLVLPLLRWGCGGPSWSVALADGLPTIVAFDLAFLIGGLLCLDAARRRYRVARVRGVVEAPAMLPRAEA